MMLSLIPFVISAEEQNETPDPNALTNIAPNGVGYSKFEDKHKLFPYPYEAIKTNPNLKQNPGW